MSVYSESNGINRQPHIKSNSLPGTRDACFECKNSWNRRSVPIMQSRSYDWILPYKTEFVRLLFVRDALLQEINRATYELLNISQHNIIFERKTWPKPNYVDILLWQLWTRLSGSSDVPYSCTERTIIRTYTVVPVIEVSANRKTGKWNSVARKLGYVYG
jgi:hypothetical protein